MRGHAWITPEFCVLLRSVVECWRSAAWRRVRNSLRAHREACSTCACVVWTVLSFRRQLPRQPGWTWRDVSATAFYPGDLPTDRRQPAGPTSHLYGFRARSPQSWPSGTAAQWRAPSYIRTNRHPDKRTVGLFLIINQCVKSAVFVTHCLCDTTSWPWLRHATTEGPRDALCQLKHCQL